MTPRQLGSAGGRQKSPHPSASTRQYATIQGPAEPVGLFGRLAREGVRLRCRGVVLHAEVPEPATRVRSWPALDRLLSRHAASLAVTVSLAHRFAERHSAERVSALLAELRREVPEILLETVGGEERLADLIASLPEGADFDLACVACCRGLAIRALHHGGDLAGLFADGECDDQNQGRRHGAEAAPGWRCAASIAGRRGRP